MFEDRKHKELDQSLTTLTKFSNDQQHSEPDQGYLAPQIEEIRVLFQSLDFIYMYEYELASIVSRYA